MRTNSSTLTITRVSSFSGFPSALNMAGSVPEAADLVVSDPVQAGTMAVMAIADTARFSLQRQHGRRY